VLRPCSSKVAQKEWLLYKRKAPPIALAPRQDDNLQFFARRSGNAIFVHWIISVDFGPARRPLGSQASNESGRINVPDSTSHGTKITATA
jgi:hypothetical protein